MKYISYSVFGDHEDYIKGAIENCKSINEFYPDWVGVFYLSKDIDNAVASEIIKFGGRVVIAERSISENPRTWRFAAALIEDAEAVIFRDTDSRLSFREAKAVEEWLNSESILHIMRDHPHHVYPIMAGMWGLKINPYSQDLVRAVLMASKSQAKSEDQYLLESIIYPPFALDSCVHDSFFSREPSSKPFPGQRDGAAFVGERISAAGEPQLHHRNLLVRYDTNNFLRRKLGYLDKFRMYLQSKTGVNLLLIIKTGRTERGSE